MEGARKIGIGWRMGYLKMRPEEVVIFGNEKVWDMSMNCGSGRVGNKLLLEN